MEADLLRLVCENPWDDAPRLIYANWCQDQGLDDRADYIRSAIELVKLAPPRRRYEIDWDSWYSQRRNGRFLALVTAIEGSGLPMTNERVDVQLTRVPPRYRSWFPGLLVVSRGGEVLRRGGPGEPVEYYQAEVIFQQDAESVEWPGKALQELVGAYDTTSWLPWARASTAWDRGFCWEMVAAQDDFLVNAGAIFAEWPITQVRMADREPWGNSSWFGPIHRNYGRIHEQSDIRWELYQRLSGPDHGGRKDYPGKVQALAALSDAAVAYGREAAWLPPLPPKPA